MTAGRPPDASSGGPAVAGFDGPPFDSLYQSLTDPAVRDLAWLLFSADLLRAQPLAPLAAPWAGDDEASAAAAWLTQLDHEPARLHAALDTARLTRLGRYAETLLGWYLAHGPAPRLVAANVALRRAGLTLGECDFLVETSDAQRLHWELAVKCYLHSGVAESGAPRLADFVGPNLRDRFDLKLAHMLDHQLRLSAREEFAWLGYQGPWLAQMFVKGWLFYRAGKGAGTRPGDPPELAARHGRGWWVTHADWADFADREGVDGWSTLPRLAWLAPRRIGPETLRASEAVERASFAQADTLAARSAVAAPVPAVTLFAGLAQAREPAMVAAFVADGAGGYVERSRGFIVPDDWPARAQAFARQ
ncbi:DUF1853 family protein [Paraburkholderia tagetis]|uniref:DUF1853 family protein n=1 Tax=Paraburkholderia tagetis TaxID=2913261 RepID=A0A9X1UET0_9BURK|nr:DUF1853 family protein [Paraburkholderia tagetis]MCG5073540.1 DUF1853 family protein [Paraburkholderia tagetis]